MSKPFKWKRSKSGRWSANGYVIERKDAGRQWRIVRDGQFWDHSWSLPDAKRQCEGNWTRRQLPPRPAIEVSTPDLPGPKPFLQVFIASSISEAILAERQRLARELRARLGTVGGPALAVLREVIGAVEGWE